jgi:hypothetical protein
MRCEQGDMLPVYATGEASSPWRRLKARVLRFWPSLNFSDNISAGARDGCRQIRHRGCRADQKGQPDHKKLRPHAAALAEISRTGQSTPIGVSTCLSRQKILLRDARRSCSAAVPGTGNRPTDAAQGASAAAAINEVARKGSWPTIAMQNLTGI